MLAWADIAASIWCQKLVKSDNLITVHMSDIDFLEPVRVGNVVEFFGEGYRVGRSSITVRIRVMVCDPLTGQNTETFRYSCVMVNIDQNLRAKPLPEAVQNSGNMSDSGEDN